MNPISNRDWRKRVLSKRRRWLPRLEDSSSGNMATQLHSKRKLIRRRHNCKTILKIIVPVNFSRAMLLSLMKPWIRVNNKISLPRSPFKWQICRGGTQTKTLPIRLLCLWQITAKAKNLRLIRFCLTRLLAKMELAWKLEIQLFSRLLQGLAIRNKSSLNLNRKCNKKSNKNSKMKRRQKKTRIN